MRPTILTIAGSDSGGGAGIQADLKTFAALGCHGSSAVVALTAQNSLGVREVLPTPVDFVRAQLEAVFEDGPVAAVKTGMLVSAEIVEAVAAALRQHETASVVVDPVMASTGGRELLADEAREALLRELLSLGVVVTPNLDEASALTGRPVTTVAEMEAAARALHGRGASGVLVKGGHLGDEAAVDVWFDGREVVHLTEARVPGSPVHGTGCVLASAVAAHLARGEDPLDAVRHAKAFVTEAIRSAYRAGEGALASHPLAGLEGEAVRAGVLRELDSALRLLLSRATARFVPEVQGNLAYAIPGASTRDDVAAFPGRLIALEGRMHSVAPPRFGGSSHIARVVLTAMQRDPSVRCCLNIRYEDGVPAAAERAGLSFASFSRADEPDDIRVREGSTLEWGTQQVLAGATGVPDIIYDEGGVGKEPMVRLLGEGPVEVVEKALRFGRQLYGEHSLLSSPS